MVDEGLIIMGIGMLVVFAFLTIMVLSMGFMSNLILKFFPEKEEPVSVLKIKAAAEANNTELAIAIAAAHSPYIQAAADTVNSELAVAVAVAHSI